MALLEADVEQSEMLSRKFDEEGRSDGVGDVFAVCDDTVVGRGRVLAASGRLAVGGGCW